MFTSLIGSRRFWIAVVALLVNILTATLTPQFKPFVDALNTFALALIAAYTVEDSARGFGQGTDR